MKTILRQLAFLLAVYLALHAVVFVISLAVVPSPKSFDTLSSKSTIYYGPNKLLAAGIPELSRSSSPQMIFLGASNVLSGFRPLDLKQSFPEYEIHNFALGNHNISRIALEVGIIEKTLTKEVLKKSLVVAGIWYGAFTQNWGQRKIPLLNVEKMLTDSGLYTRKDGALYPLVSADWMPSLVSFLRPYYFAEYLVEMGQFKNKDFGLTFVQHDITDSEMQKKNLEYLDKWIGRNNGRLSVEQFRELLAFREIMIQGWSNLLIVDLPIPRWHSEGSVYFKDYQHRKGKYLAEVLACPRVRYLDLQNDSELCKAELYYDGTHPNLLGALLWSKAFGAQVKKTMLCGDEGTRD